MGNKSIAGKIDPRWRSDLFDMQACSVLVDLCLHLWSRSIGTCHGIKFSATGPRQRYIVTPHTH